MPKEQINAFEDLPDTMMAIGGRGALLIAGTEPVNPMTIGWAMIGPMWSKPTFMVLVRPSRYTYELMEKSDTFSVNVPTEAMADVCKLCGTKSGRNMDKIAEAGLTVEQGRSLDVATIAECPVHYECKIILRDKINPKGLIPDIGDVVYRSGNVHALYYGRIVGAYRDEQL